MAKQTIKFIYNSQSGGKAPVAKQVAPVVKFRKPSSPKIARVNTNARNKA